ncbi:hypothetical protein ACHOLT_14130 [Desulfitobacterium sp. Sab5]|uniref:hypothetical protein n=1 Tax=Desulfitobacterium nosdiversum TaxID=3375356 RepID=UPI003CF507B5
MKKKWLLPTFLLGIMLVLNIFRWGDIGGTTNNGIITKVKIDRWNGSVWEQKYGNGNYSEKQIKPSIIESNRPRITKTVEVTGSTEGKPMLPGESISDWFKRLAPEKHTETINVAPEEIYWLSSNGLTKIWFTSTMSFTFWLVISIGLSIKNIYKNSSVDTHV